MDKSPGRIAAGSPRSGFRRPRHLYKPPGLAEPPGAIIAVSGERLLGSLFLVRNDGARPGGPPGPITRPFDFMKRTVRRGMGTRTTL